MNQSINQSINPSIIQFSSNHLIRNLNLPSLINLGAFLDNIWKLTLFWFSKYICWKESLVSSVYLWIPLAVPNTLYAAVKWRTTCQWLFLRFQAHFWLVSLLSKISLKMEMIGIGPKPELQKNLTWNSLSWNHWFAPQDAE